MADGGHVAGAVAFAQPGLVVAEGDVEPVFDAPVGSDRGGGFGRREGARGDEIARLRAQASCTLDAGFGAQQASGRWQAQFAWEAAITFEPVDLPEHAHAPLFDAAVALIDDRRECRALQATRRSPSRAPARTP